MALPYSDFEPDIVMQHEYDIYRQASSDSIGYADPYSIELFDDSSARNLNGSQFSTHHTTMPPPSDYGCCTHWHAHPEGETRIFDDLWDYPDPLSSCHRHVGDDLVKGRDSQDILMTPNPDFDCSTMARPQSQVGEFDGDIDYERVEIFDAPPSKELGKVSKQKGCRRKKSEIPKHSVDDERKRLPPFESSKPKRQKRAHKVSTIPNDIREAAPSKFHDKEKSKAGVRDLESNEHPGVDNDNDGDSGNDTLHHDGSQQNAALQRNRVSARKCRDRKRSGERDLKQKKVEVEDKHRHLMNCVEALGAEVWELNRQIFRHAACENQLLQRYINLQIRQHGQMLPRANSATSLASLSSEKSIVTDPLSGQQGFPYCGTS